MKTNEKILSGMFILDLDGKEIEVLNLKEAISQCKAAVAFHDECIKNRKTDPDAIMFKGLKEYWEHSLFELEKIEMKMNHMKLTA